MIKLAKKYTHTSFCHLTDIYMRYPDEEDMSLVVDIEKPLKTKSFLYLPDEYYL